LAPEGCTQYFFSSTDTVQTFNYDGGLHLAEQDQNICVRRERGLCRVCWAAAIATDFDVNASTGTTLTKGTKCCGYGTNGVGTKGFDCAIIPGASKNTVMSSLFAGDEFCGSVGLSSTAGGGNMVTVCSNKI